MILGSVGCGILMGLAGALMTWVVGYPAMTVLLAYSVIGSLGTLCIAAMSGLRKADSVLFLR